jgi:ADP-heptose:LPS heptosyltransferase
MGGVGDNLIAASVCRPLKQAGYMVEVISQPPFSELFENNPYVDKLSVHGDWPKDQGAWQAWFSNRAEEYDKFVNLSHSVEILHAVFPASTEFWWPEKFRRKRLGGSYLESTHDLFDMPYDFGPLFFPTEEETDLAVATRIKFGAKPLVAWCISGTRIDKTHPMAPQVISRLIRELGANVVMFGRSHPHYDYTLASQVMDMVEVHNGNRDGLHFAGGLEADGARWPIRRVLTQVANCDLVIGPDTGPMWAVAFEYVPKIMLHSHASVENITKHWVNTTSLAANPQRVPCWPCHRLHDNFSTCRLNKWNNGAACISDISVDAILTAARELLRC